MAGVTNAPFRRLCRHYGAGLYVSEMVNARGLIEGGAKSWELAAFDPDESPRSIQLYGTDPTTMHAAVRRLVDEGHVDHIDLNFGCPVRKVTRHGGGSALTAEAPAARRGGGRDRRRRRQRSRSRSRCARASTTTCPRSSTPAASPRTRAQPPSPCTPAPRPSSTRGGRTGRPSPGSRRPSPSRCSATATCGRPPTRSACSARPEPTGSSSAVAASVGRGCSATWSTCSRAVRPNRPRRSAR